MHPYSFRALVTALLVLLAAPQAAYADRSGDFDYYVLALSWSPTYCERAGRKADPLQCRASKPYRFIVHGLWPQYERGYPDFCDTGARSRLDAGTVGTILDIMPSRGLASHQWIKHGSCSGLDPQAYFALTRRAFEAVRIPAAFRSVAKTERTSATAVETAFRLANPGLRDNAIAVSCEAGRLSEVRICLTRDLRFRSCPFVDRNGCRSAGLTVPPPR
ncbi:ribonuclease T2 [Stappia albiluteola]|uniref:ribonuclease T2 n=1 Tax=Stappia albiluteola TaxID=2758565 RepID=UPI001F410899|nr:ribonuclease T2 [Stappia albiluteola]